MSALSSYLENRLADHVLGDTPYNAPNSVFLALFTSNPTENGTGTECGSPGSGYARVEITNNSANWPSAVAGIKSNGTRITFPAWASTWGTVTHWGLYDAVSGGNLLMFGAVVSSFTPATGDTVTVDPGGIDITFE
jgi:hypothetical protein